MTELQDRLQAALGDAYRIEREIHGGGMSRLFLATEASLERSVVVKVLPPEFASDVSAARFMREILVAAQLQHPHVLPVLSSGTREGLYYYIMPFVKGESLKHRLERDGRLSVGEALNILREVSDALGFAHRMGVVHRDIKPANILLEEGHAVLTDFGIARAAMGATPAHGSTRLTDTGMSVGTIGYMAPEQLVGERDLDARADVYALAIVGYEMFTGKQPFDGPTAQAILAAHLTEEPKPLHDVVPEVPLPVSEAIAKALAKNPDDRFRNAGELRAALELPQTAAFTAMHATLGGKRRRWPVIAAAVAVLAATAVGAKIFLGSGAEINKDLLAIAPFDVRDADTTWRQGLVDVLSRKFDGAGPIKTVSASVVINKWDGRADQATAQRLGEATGAGLVLYGSLEGEGEDSVVLSAQILDVARKEILPGTRLERRGEKSRVNTLADSITVPLLKELQKVLRISAFRQTSLGASSLTALKAFLQGEQFYRRSQWDSALAYYERAVSEDTAFALAFRRAGLVRSWTFGAEDSVSRAFLLRAGRFNHSLAPRDSLLIHADSIRAALTAFELDTAYLARARRLFSTLEEARRFYPDDPEVWFALGDARFHYGFGPTLTVPERQVMRAFQRSVELDSMFTPAYIHLVELGYTLQGEAEGRKWAAAYLALDPRDVEAEGIRVVEQLAGHASRRIELVPAVVDTLAPDALFRAWTTLRRWADADELAVRIARARTGGPTREGVWYTDAVYTNLFLALELAYRGHFRDAREVLGPNIEGVEARLYAELVQLGGVAPDEAQPTLAQWTRAAPAQGIVALPFLADVGDTAAIAAYARSVEHALATADDAVARRDARYRHAAARAYLALARRDSSSALALFGALPDTLCLLCYSDRLTRARLLVRGGRVRDAEPLLDERLQILLSPMEIAFALERGRVAEKLGRRDKATEAYELVVRAWQSGDPETRPAVAEARSGLERLGEGRRGVASAPPVRRDQRVAGL